MSNIPGLPINAFMLAISAAIVILVVACPIWNRSRRAKKMRAPKHQSGVRDA